MDGDDGNKLKAHYLSVLKQQPGVIHLPTANGLVGYVDEADGNPVVIVEESSPRTHDNVCLSWFDTHLTWDDPGQRDIQPPAFSGPPYRYHAKVKAYWNSPAETRALLARAQTVSLAPFADKFQNALPIDMNVVNGFDHFADFLSGKVKHIYLPLRPARPEGEVSLDKNVGRSGHSSVSLVSKTDKGIWVTPEGPEWMVTPGRQVKISAWVKTKDVTGDGFYLESGFQKDQEQLGPKYYSAKLTGTHDWTLLEIPMPITPAEATFLSRGRVFFRLSGQGTAWVDDFVFSEHDVDSPSKK